MREKQFVFWLIALLVVVVLNLPVPATLAVRAGLRDNVAPFQNTMSLVIHQVSLLFSRVGRTAEVLREKQELQVELAELRSRLRRLEQFESENQTLRRQLGFAILSPRRLLLCEVVARGDMSGWWQTLRLNKGADDGVTVGMAVIGIDGLIGRTAAVAKRSCDVLLITDPSCKVACKLVRNGAFGIMQGAGVSMGGRVSLEMLASARPCELDYVSTEHTLQPRDVVHTSGLGGVFPEGLPVGRVGAVRLDSSGLYQQASIIPSADLSTLRYAFVVIQ
ncbi:MAG: rod shape-determining protein MreC [Verrucomicrobia bacterium]|nr:rod shape-determining protein MreC [Verrucomicrobiota bacterium]